MNRCSRSTDQILEAWSDETTFLVFRGSHLLPGEAPRLEPPREASPAVPWPDPRTLVERAHRLGIHVLLWQIPVIKQVPEEEVRALEAGTEADRLALDRNRWLWEEALRRGYVLRTPGGEPFRIPEGRWFAGSLVLDLTNPEAVTWWLDQRAYLLDHLGIDGFKTDGGDHFLTRAAVGRNGSGWTLRNTYPDLWAEAYARWMERKGRPPVTFSRAGYLKSPHLSIHWAGDQVSTYEAFR